MGTFECDRCGKCCRSFGAFITIERQLSSRDYYCRFGITREVFLAHIEPEYADAIAEKYEEGGCGDDASRKNVFFFRRSRTVTVLPAQFTRHVLSSAVNSSVTGW